MPDFGAAALAMSRTGFEKIDSKLIGRLRGLSNFVTIATKITKLAFLDYAT
jgi:hypothetical protein